jgi:AcrR family transcriptional regulator
MERPTGLRERKKAAIRWALHQAAVRLVADQGLEHVTVEAIADAATLSRRTFSNHFSSKEEALFYSEAVRTETLLSLMHERPADEDARTAFTRAAELMSADTTPYLDAEWLAARRLLHRYPTLVQHHAAAYAATERGLTVEIARRLSGNPADVAGSLRARVLAATFLAALRAATTHWLETSQGSLPDVVAEALKVAQE